ncbi:hypothetical protein WN51_11970, partial [Melipona quadrifasciata]
LDKLKEAIVTKQDSELKLRNRDNFRSFVYGTKHAKKLLEFGWKILSHSLQFISTFAPISLTF